MFLSVLTGIDCPVNVSVGVGLHTCVMSITTIREDFEPSADIRLVVSQSSKCLKSFAFELPNHPLVDIAKLYLGRHYKRSL